MKGIILAAGYATRLYPLTLNTPKPLLKIKGVPIIEIILAEFLKVDEIDEIYVVTNAKFTPHFEEWLEAYNKKIKNRKKIIIVNDGTTTNEARIGAVGDLVYVIEKFNIQDDLLIAAGDNLFEIDLRKLCASSKENGATIMGVYEFESLEQVKNRFGVVVVNDENRVVNFQEKPSDPLSTLAATAIYVIREEQINTIIELYSRPHDNELNLGEIVIDFLSKDIPVYCEFLNSWFDIGTTDHLEQANSQW